MNELVRAPPMHVWAGPADADRTSRLRPAIFAALLGFVGVAHGDECVGDMFFVSVNSGARTVPEGHVWKISGLSPYVSERGVGTADLYVDGQVQVGEDKAYAMYGDIEIVIGRPQQSPIWILAGSTLSVGDSRQRVRVEQCRDDGA